MSETQACLSQNDLREMKNDQLSQQQLEQFENHLTDCKPCRELLDATDVNPFPDWQSEIRPALRETYDLRLAETRAEDSAGNETFLRLLSPSEDPRMLGRIGNYEVVGIIGQGGMGVVFKAFETSLNRFVAIKMLLPQLTANGAARKRFLREAQAAAAVVDDHVLPIFGVDQWQETPYLVMKYCGGQTLQQRIGQQGPLELKEVLRIGTQAAKGLAAAHAQGLVHRDVKPSNILLDGSVDRAVLMDFGLARAVDDASITRTGIISGTPQYMSPEQVRADSVDARSDLFSLGSTLYAMCAGRPPFRAESAYSVMHRITHESPTPICEVNSDVPQWMGDVVDRLMSKNPEDRFKSAQEVAGLLEDCLAHVQQPTTKQLPDAVASISSSRGGSSSWGKWLALAMFAFFLTLGGILLVIELNKGKLVIESAADNVPVRITQGDVEVEKLTVSKDGKTIKIAAGTYSVEVDGGSDNIAVDGNTVSVTRGGVETVKIELKQEPDAVAGGWTPPENPDLKKILKELKTDKQSGNYQRALAKVVWYHQNAPPGTPRSSVLREWLELGEDYPPALDKMRRIRDATEVKIRDSKEARLNFDDFQTFKQLNRTLREQERTADLFKWLEEKNPKDAERFYSVSEAALVRQREYKVCGKYVKPIFEVKKICFDYEEGLRNVSRYGNSHLSYAENTFVQQSTTLVEILANSDRKAEATTAANSLKKHVEGKEISVRLEKAIDAAMQKKPPLPTRQATAVSIAEDWTPPENPDPNKILEEAKADKQSGSYKIALMKYVWYHENAIRFDPNYSVSLVSSALSDWLELGEEYPPALDKMRKIRDATEVKIRDSKEELVNFGDFQIFQFLNTKLREYQRTVDLFKWLDEENAKVAEIVYPIYEAALVKRREYKVCEKYIEPIFDVKKICFDYEEGLSRASKYKSILYVTENAFVQQSATLVEILSNIDRKAEATTAADSLKKYVEGKEVSVRLEKAIDAAMQKKPPLPTPAVPEASKALEVSEAPGDTVAEGWTPPENPDPRKILKEAKADRGSGDYQRALAKHVWYHENALLVGSGQGGVRGSVALKSWLELGKKYPPALAKMREIRDATEAKIRDEKRVRVKFQDFQDVQAFNSTFKQDQRTVDLFKWLEKDDPEDAERIYIGARITLIRAKEYEICGRYVDPIVDVRQICDRYDSGVKSSSRIGKRYVKTMERVFVQDSATLVEILVMNGRQTEAQKAADSLKKFAGGKDVSDRLEKAIDAELKKKPLIETLEGETGKSQLEKSTGSVAKTWMPPENPDPSKILEEAKADRSSGDYQRALEKHLWYHQNALRLEPSQKHARVSSALNDWRQLGEKYLPALDKMREIRDATEMRIRDENRIRVKLQDFSDFKALNRTLGEDHLTAKLFMWLDEVDAEDAKRIYLDAEEALVKEWKYKICGKYVDPMIIELLCIFYDDASKSPAHSNNKHYDFEKDFVDTGARLIEILVNNDRQDEAQEAAESLRKFAEGKDISERLKKAIDAAMEKKPPLPTPEVPEATVAPADPVAEDWTPPENPDPRKILDEAAADKHARKYETALAKHLWYHENALRIRPSQTGVRLSFALSSWLELGKEYPPALAKMREVRDATEAKIRDKKRVRVKFKDIQDVDAFNRTFKEDQRTVELFKWLEKDDPEDAQRIYPGAQDTLLRVKEYEICGKYVDPIVYVGILCDRYDSGVRSSSKIGKRFIKTTERVFVKDSAILIEILVNNDRQAEAQKAADKLKKFAEGKDVSDRLEKAIDTAMENKPAM